jgi:hypothetical protein
VSPVRYELGFYIPENEILHSNRSKNPQTLRLVVEFIKWFRITTPRCRVPWRGPSPKDHTPGCAKEGKGTRELAASCVAGDLVATVTQPTEDMELCRFVEHCSNAKGHHRGAVWSKSINWRHQRTMKRLEIKVMTWQRTPRQCVNLLATQRGRSTRAGAFKGSHQEQKLHPGHRTAYYRIVKEPTDSSHITNLYRTYDVQEEWIYTDTAYTTGVRGSVVG